MIRIKEFYVELVDSDYLPCKHVCIWFQVGIYAIRAELTLTGIRFSYMEDDLNKYTQMKKVVKGSRKVAPLFVFDCISFAKAVLCCGSGILPTKFFERLKNGKHIQHTEANSSSTTTSTSTTTRGG